MSTIFFQPKLQPIDTHFLKHGADSQYELIRRLLQRADLN